VLFAQQPIESAYDRLSGTDDDPLL